MSMNDLTHFGSPPPATEDPPAGSEAQPEAPPASFQDPGPEIAGSIPGPQLSEKQKLIAEHTAAMRAARALGKTSGLYDPSKSITKVSYSHDAMIDLIIANPGVNQGELAQAFGYTEAWVSQVMSSDAFKERLASRKKELVDPAIIASIEQRFEAVAMLSLERLKEKLEKSALPTMDTILAGVNVASRALGYGARPDPRVQVAIQTVVHVPAKARDSEEWLDQRTAVEVSRK